MGANVPDQLFSIEPLSVADLSNLERVLADLLERETSDWPTRERHTYIERLKHLRREVRKRIR